VIIFNIKSNNICLYLSELSGSVTGVRFSYCSIVVHDVCYKLLCAAKMELLVFYITVKI